MSFEANNVINGLYGKLYDENGQELQATQEFESKIEFEKTEVKIPGQLMTSNKVVGAKGTGSLKILKLDSRLQKKVLTSPAAKYNYVAKLADPTALGQEGVLLIGVSFDGADLQKWKLGELVEIDLDFTFDNFRYLDTIG